MKESLIYRNLLKRLVDCFFSIVGIFLLGWLIFVCWILVKVDLGKGFFKQERVGKDGQLFKVWKIRTMKSMKNHNSTITKRGDPRITRMGRLLRRTKIDELPQLWNVLKGDMSFVGPRPDVPGYADKLNGEDRIILTIRPGITGPAQLYFKNEEELLASQTNSQRYNDNVIWPQKVEINKLYVKEISFWRDMNYIYKTIFS